MTLTTALACGGGDEAGPSSPPPPGSPAITGVAVSPSTLSLTGVGSEATLQATLSPSGATGTIEWRVDGATILAITPNAATASVRGLAGGTARVFARAGGIEGSAEITVTPIARGLSVSPNALTLIVGQTRGVTATLSADAGVPSALTWTSDNASVATVSAQGVVTGISQGMTVVKVASAAFPAITAQVNVSVNPPPPPVFPMEWTPTNDGVIGAAELHGSYNAGVMLPDQTYVIVGNSGLIAERAPNGTWTKVAVPTSNDLRTVVVAGAAAWAAGTNGTVLRRTVSGWVAENPGTTAGINSIALTADGSGFASLTGNTSMIERTAAGVWQTMPHPTQTSGGSPSVTISPGGLKYAIFGSPTSSTEPAFHRFANGAWIAVPKPTQAEGISSIFAIGENDLLLGGIDDSRGTISRWNNGAWTRELTDPVFQTARTGGFFSRCLDGTILGGVNFGAGWVRSASGTWSLRVPPPPFQEGYATASCASPATIFQVRAANYITRTEGSTIHTEILRMNLNRVGLGANNLAFTGALNTAVALRRSGSTWTSFRIPSADLFNSSSGPAFAAWGDNEGLIVAEKWVGDWNGSGFTWSSMSLPARALWGASPNDVWAAGPSSSAYGGLHRRQGSIWSRVETASSFEDGWFEVHGAGERAFAVRSGVIGHWSGTSFSRVPLPGSNSPIDIVAFSATSAIAMGSSELLRWNGSAWSSIFVPGWSGTLTTITGRSENEFYLFNTSGDVFGCSLTSCTLIQRLPSPVRKARIVGNRGLAVGDNGMIVYGALRATGATRRSRRE